MPYFDVDWMMRFDFGAPRSLDGLRGVCLHTTENSASSRADAVARWQLDTRSGSYHVIVDSAGTRLRCNTDDWSTWSTGNQGNDILLHLAFVARAEWTREQWLEQDGMLRAGATVAAHWCRTYGWPARQVDVYGLPGITTHAATRAWGGTDHSDPGPNFPWDVFLHHVNDILDPPAPTTAQETTVTPEQADRIERKLDLILEQLAGRRDDGGEQSFSGWEQGGGRTMYDVVAAIAARSGVPGTFDTLGAPGET